MPIDNLEFDIAISFLVRDLSLALEMERQIGPAMKVFVYSRQQEFVAATDGLDSFRSVFKDRATLSVVLFRSPWGETPWTGVEEVAIRDRCLQTKYRSLVFVRLDDAAVPPWIPDTHIQFDMKRYPLEQLVGVIKSHAEDLGAKIQTVSNADRAKSQQQRRVFDEETITKLSQRPDYFETATNELFAAIEQEIKPIAESTGWKMECGLGAVIGGFVVTTGSQTIQIGVRDLYTNTARNAYLQVCEYDAGISVQRPGVHYYFPEGPPEPASTLRLDIKRRPQLDWCWEFNGKVASIRETASAIIQILLDRVDREASRRNV